MSNDKWSDFDEVKQLTTQEMDALVLDMAMKKEKYDIAHDASSEANTEYVAAREKVLLALAQAGKTKYHVDGLGLVQKITQYKVTTPKDLENKRLLLDYFQTKGPEVYLAYVGVNYQSLNSFYNQEAEAAAAKGQIFHMPGVEAPTSEDNIRFTKERKK